MEYTVDVKEDGIYKIDAEVAATKSGGTFHLTEYGLDSLTFIANMIEVPVTGSTTDFKTLSVVCKNPISAGQHRICLNVDQGGFYIKNIHFSRYEEDKTMTCTVKRNPTTVTVGDKTTITVTASSKTSTVANVKVYDNNLLIGTLTEAPYELEYEPISAGKHNITATVTDAEGKSKTSDIVKGNGGKAIGYTANGEWAEYTINVKEAGEYEYTATVSNGSSSTGGFTIGILKGTSTTATTVAKVSFSGTGGWDTYTTVTGKLTQKLTVGEQRLRFTINPGNCNIDKVVFKCLTTGVEEVIVVNAEEGDQFSLSGQKVGADYRGIVIKNGRKVLKK